MATPRSFPSDLAPPHPFRLAAARRGANMSRPKRPSAAIDPQHPFASWQETDTTRTIERRASTGMTMPTATRKRAQRRHGCESMFSREQLLSRDLHITGVSKSKHGSSWRYHIEVLDIRASLAPFEDQDATTLSRRGSVTGATSIGGDSDETEDTERHSLPPVVRYSVLRRYNDFRQLYQHLADHFAPEVMEMLPEFPAKGLVSFLYSDNDKLLRYRKEALQRFLRALDELEDTKWCPALTLFLSPDIEQFSLFGGGFADAECSQSVVSRSSLGEARISQNGGYVSLSCVQTPEIRFSKQPAADGRSDWKRRKIVPVAKPTARHTLELVHDKIKASTQSDVAVGKDAVSCSHSLVDSDSDTDEDDKQEQAPPASLNPLTALMKLLSM